MAAPSRLYSSTLVLVRLLLVLVLVLLVLLRTGGTPLTRMAS
jgi:hypothetical protein